MMKRRSIAAVVALVTATACLTACGGAQSRFQAHMKRGQALFTEGDYTKASIEFRNALQIEPKDVGARLAAAKADEKLRKPREAFGLYQAVIDASPDNLEAREGQARMLVYANQPEQAVKVLEPAFAKHPNEALLYGLRAAARLQLKNRDGAIADADRALQLAPDNEEVIEVRAGLYKQAGDIAGARTLVEGGVHKLPNSRALRETLVDLELVGKDPQLAEQSLAELIKIAPQEPRYRLQLAVLYSRDKNLDAAQKVLEDAVQALPKSVDPKLALVDFIDARRTHAQAEQTLRQFIEHEPDNYTLRLGLGSLQQRAKDDKEAIATYEEIVRRAGTEPDGLIARNRLAAIAAAQGRDADARKLVAEVLQKNPRDTDALARRAIIELADKDPASAIGDLRAVLRDHPQSVQAQRMLANAYVANGQSALAEQALHAALDVFPDDATTRLELARLLEQTQRGDEAVTLLEDSVRRAPADAAARAELIRAYLAKQDFDSARKSAEDLKTLLPMNGEGWYYAGMAAVGQKKIDEAQKELLHSLSLQPQATGPMTALARLYVALGQTPKAIELVKNASQLEPSNTQTLNLLGELYLSQHDTKHAVEAFNRVTALAPQWWVPYRNLAAVKLEEKDGAGAIGAYQAGLKAAPGELQLVNELGLLYEKDHRVDEAIALFDTTYKQNPRAVVLANNLALLLVTYKTDRASLDRARDLSAPFASSNDGKLLDTYGWVHFKRGEYAEALPALGRAADRVPASKEIRYHLGMAELHAGQTDRARADLEAAVSGSPGFMGVDEARTTLASLKDKDSAG
jgi:tetratricopeptide (TPR) repeat protein